MCPLSTNLKWTLKAHYMNVHKQSKEDADRMANEVKERYIQEHGEEPVPVPKGLLQ